TTAGATSRGRDRGRSHAAATATTGDHELGAAPPNVGRASAAAGAAIFHTAAVAVATAVEPARPAGVVSGPIAALAAHEPVEGLTRCHGDRGLTPAAQTTRPTVGGRLGVPRTALGAGGVDRDLGKPVGHREGLRRARAVEGLGDWLRARTGRERPDRPGDRR